MAAGAGWLAILLAGCAPSLRVRTDYDREVSFAALRSYSWVDSVSQVSDSAVSPFLERRIRRAVDGVLVGRGFEVTEFGTPDFLVTAFVLGPSPETSTWHAWWAAPCGPIVTVGIGFGYPYGYPFGYGMYHGHWHWATPYYRHPWGYVCGYRVGFGYLWLPVYEEPGRRLEGTLVIDVLDAGSHELIWRGSAEGLEFTGGQTMPQEELDRIVARILADFPPGAQ